MGAGRAAQRPLGVVRVLVAAIMGCASECRDCSGCVGRYSCFHSGTLGVAPHGTVVRQHGPCTTTSAAGGRDPEPCSLWADVTNGAPAAREQGRWAGADGVTGALQGRRTGPCWSNLATTVPCGATTLGDLPHQCMPQRPQAFPAPDVSASSGGVCSLQAAQRGSDRRLKLLGFALQAPLERLGYHNRRHYSSSLSR